MSNPAVKYTDEFRRETADYIGTVKILSQIDRGGLGPALL